MLLFNLKMTQRSEIMYEFDFYCVSAHTELNHFFFVWFIQIAAAEKNKIFIEFSYFTGCKGPGCNIRIWYNVKTRLEQSLW